MSNRFHPVLTACALVAATVAPVSAETPQEIFESALARYEKRVASIETLTIVQDVMGMESTTRLRKEMVDGRPELVSDGDGRAGDLGSMYRNFGSLAENATLEGSEEIDGNACWAVHVTELGEMSVPAEGSDDFEAKDGTFYVDKKQLVVRRVLMNGVATSDGEGAPVTMTLNMKDYREVDGWLHPFRTEVSVAGVGGAETAEMAEMREGMAKMKEELAKMPADQRQMMEQMMKERMPDLEKMVESGNLQITVTVKEVRVNEKPN